MEYTRLKLVGLRRLRLPGSFRGLLREQRVHELAKHMTEHGQWIPALVRQKDGRVLDGLDRVAAAWLNKQESVWAVLCECTDEEAGRIEAEVNVHRRHDPNERARSLVLVDKLEAELDDSEVEQARSEEGRPVTKRGLARRKVAEILGIKESSIKVAEHRERTKHGEKSTKPLNTLGMELPEEMAREIESVQRYFDTAARGCAAALAALSTIDGRLKYPPSRLQKLRQEIQDMGASVRNARPEMLCPYCKALPQLVNGCKTCVGCGFITANMTSGIPKELLDEEEPKVFVSGQARPVSDYITEEPELEETDGDPFGLGASE